MDIIIHIFSQLPNFLIERREQNDGKIYVCERNKRGPSIKVRTGGGGFLSYCNYNQVNFLREPQKKLFFELNGHRKKS